jgi:hypothetical protein
MKRDRIRSSPLTDRLGLAAYDFGAARGFFDPLDRLGQCRWWQFLTWMSPPSVMASTITTLRFRRRGRTPHKQSRFGNFEIIGSRVLFFVRKILQKADYRSNRAKEHNSERHFHRR